MARQLYVNLPVKDLVLAKAFYAGLGFTFDRRFTDEHAACVVLGDGIYAMLLVEKFFGTFTKKRIADARKTTEVLIAISAKDRWSADEMVRKAVANGGREARPAEDHGWMYTRSFEDPDGHIWEVGHMDVASMPAEMREKGLAA